MAPLNPFPVAALPSFKKPPIELIVGQVRVPVIPALLEATGIGPFQAKAGAAYPHLRREDQLAVRLSRSEEPRGDSVRLWRFEDMSHQWTLTVAPEFVALEAKEYQRFVEFRDRLVEAAQWLCEVYRPAIRVRVGLRYVDRLAADKYPGLPDDWLSKANPAVLGLLRQAPTCEQRSFLEHRFALGESWGLTFRATATRAKPRESIQDELILDTDAYDKSETDFSSIGEILDALKGINYSAFSWAAGDLLQLLERA